MNRSSWSILPLIVLAACGAAFGAVPATLPAPTLVSLRANDTPLASVAADLGKQAGLSIRVIDANVPPVTLRVEREPFWAAMRELCGKASCNPSTSNAPDLILLEPGDTFAKFPFVLSGPMLLQAEEMHRTQTVHATGANPSSTFDISFTAYIDPAIRVLQHAGEIKVISIQDDAGNSLASTQPPELAPGDVPDTEPLWQFSLTSALTYPKNPGKRIASFKGEVILWALKRSETWEVADFRKARNVSKSVGGVRFTIAKATPGAESLKVEVSATRDGASDERWNLFKTLSLAHTLRACDAKGRALYLMGAGGPRDERRVAQTCQFSPNDPNAGVNVGEPVKLIWELPLEIEPMSIPFEFKNLPIP